MRFPKHATLMLFILIAIPGSLRAQDDAVVTARYDAAIEWVNLVFDGEFSEAAGRANEAVAAQMTADMLEQALGQLSPQLGSLNSLEPKRQGTEQGFHQVVLTGVFANGTFDVQVYMANDHTVAGFFVRPPS